MPFSDAIRIGASGAVADYTVDRSLRFNTTDQTILTKTLSTSPTNRKKTTLSFWFKKSKLSTAQGVITSGASGTGGSATGTRIYLNADDTLKVDTAVNNSAVWGLNTTRKFRDPSAWIHFCMSLDTTQSTASDRVKIYFNGVQETSFSSASYPSQDYDDIWAYGNYRIGDWGGDYGYYIGYQSYIAEVITIDGQALDPSSFTETDATTGQLIPKNPSGLTFGTNGFHLKFADNSGTSATTLGKDSSGNDNNFTPSNFSVSAGDGNDSVTDTPTLNKATLNPLTGWTNNATLKNGNLEMTGSSGFKEISTIAVDGTSKFYYEIVRTNAAGWQLVGVFVGQPNNPSSALNNSAIWGFASTQATYFGGSYTSTNDVPGWGNNDVMGIKYENGTLKLYKNGTLASASTSSVPTGDIVFAYIANDNTNAAAFARFSSDSWTQDSAAGVDATWELSSANLPDPTILLPNKHFDTLLYTGTGSSQNITGLEFQPDWVWIKKRSNSENHELQDAVRGATKRLASNTTDAESTVAGSISAFNSDGFTVVDAGTTNENGNTYVAWNWNAGDTDSATYTVTVVDDSGNKFRFDGYNANAVTLDLAEGGTYVFNYPSAHPLRFSTTSDGTHGGGSEYTTGVTHNSSTQVTLVVASGAPNLYYYCANHSGMGGFVRTNTESGSSNFDGGIISDVKANPTAGFSIVGWTGTNGNGTLGHGLGVAPQVIIMKGRNVTDQWTVGHQGLDASNPWHKGIPLNTNASTQDNSGFWNDTAPTSTVFSKGTWNDGYNMVAYCFSEVSSFSKFGSYVGNSDADGTFVYMGFRPAWIMIKIITGNDDWPMYDNKRDPFNVGDHRIFANTSGAEGAVGQEHFDFVSNGIKFRKSKNPFNASGSTYIFLAFAESPFKYARAR